MAAQTAEKDTAPKAAADKDAPSDKEIAVQNQASVSTPGVPPPAAQKDTSKEAAKAREDALSVADHLGSLDRETLVQVELAVAAALRNKGQEPAQAPPTDEELARLLPQNNEESADLDVSKALAAIKKSDGPELKESQILKVAVLQATGMGDKGIGQKYVKVITADGQKHYAKI